MISRALISSLFPYTTLFRSWIYPHLHAAAQRMSKLADAHKNDSSELTDRLLKQLARELLLEQAIGEFARIIDRKSTRLNSSHQIISYAVFCLKKKNSKRRYY